MSDWGRRRSDFAVMCAALADTGGGPPADLSPPASDLLVALFYLQWTTGTVPADPATAIARVYPASPEAWAESVRHWILVRRFFEASPLPGQLRSAAVETARAWAGQERTHE